MSLVGNLKDLGLAEILQIVSLSRKSGVLEIRNEEREARIVFRQGQVVKATATTFPVDLPELLLSSGTVDAPTLDAARFLQHSGGFSRRLGDILISDFRLDAAQLEDIVRGVVEDTVYSLFDWEEGTFDFDLREDIDSIDDLHLDPLQYTLQRGHNPQFLAMEGSRKLDEKRHAEQTSGNGVQEETDDFEFDLLSEPDGADPTVEPEPEQAPDASGLPLILVDDDAVFGAALSEVLGRSGYAVSFFAGGEDALIAIDSCWRTGRFPLLLVALNLPRMDGSGRSGGLELLELVHGNFSSLQALALSDGSDAAAEQAARRLGYRVTVRPAPADLARPEGIAAFGDTVLAHLSEEAVTEPVSGSPSINIGDDLRLEMGEDAVPARTGGQSTGISLLRGMLEELNDPALGGDITLLVLRFASEFMARAVLFIVKGDDVVGFGQFGIDGGDQPGDAVVRALRFPLSEKTLFSTVVETQLPVKLQLDDSRWCRYLRDSLGGVVSEAFLGPIVSEGVVVAILYGDNGIDARPIGDTDSLEIFLSQAGIAMEKGLLQRRLKEKHLEGL